ncbi:hypothetical protein F503_01323 [Ophiostoma piceae UAMH 11346]|uniref:Uncharacterized protein n=1 Tax=Ophiostoma piceae (strain UAMH 11346) TaxID=1262450 RepID=S3BSS4_OPHP1|nr:hypothetical protein F503_01323 [Ophiostoma piceae UAMH 11346]
MSDTSDYTVVNDSSSDAQVSVPLSSPSSHKVMGHAGDEIREVLPIIRNFIITLHDIHLQIARDDGVPEESVRRLSHNGTVPLTNLLENLGRIVARFPEKGYVETADLMTDIITEASSILAAGGEDDSKEELLAQGAVLTYKCMAQAQLRASQSGYNAQARLLRGGWWESTIQCVIELHSLKDRDAVRIVANLFHQLIPKYMRSITATYGSASGEWMVYVDYCIAVTDTLVEGRKEEVSEEAKETKENEENGENGTNKTTEGAESMKQGSGSSKDSEEKNKLMYNYTTTWYEVLGGGGWQMSVEDPVSDDSAGEDNGPGSTKNMKQKDGKHNTTWDRDARHGEKDIYLKTNEHHERVSLSSMP